MAVMERKAWSDERMDDLAKRMDKGFDEVKVEIRDLRGSTDKGFDEVKTEIRDLRGHTDNGLAELRSEMNAMQRTMLIGFVTLFASIAASVIGGILTTQL